MPDQETTKPAPKQPRPRLFVPLIILAIFLFIAGIVILLVGKLIVVGILALLGSIFTLGTQVSRNNKL
jgi:hypothetical protein